VRVLNDPHVFDCRKYSSPQLKHSGTLHYPCILMDGLASWHTESSAPWFLTHM
jgi:hypothetical protein